MLWCILCNFLRPLSEEARDPGPHVCSIFVSQNVVLEGAPICASGTIESKILIVSLLKYARILAVKIQSTDPRALIDKCTKRDHIRVSNQEEMIWH